MEERVGYVIEDDGWDQERGLHTSYQLLDLLAEHIVAGEVELEWYTSDDWPAAVRAAADRLARRVAPHRNIDEDLCVIAELDESTKSDCLLVAPFAHDASFTRAGGWRDRDIAYFHDENYSRIFWLTESELPAAAAIVGPDNLLTLEEYHRRRRAGSLIGRLRNHLTRKG
ncbi:hypothetical protein [Branchiibius cervicis]|uniref:Uncharacterized protein n=1 Tax=Branchiibius cervicis TaxID=908252 RepID=A0ABW2AV36_9MICO